MADPMGRKLIVRQLVILGVLRL
eukprot:SAG31_NODE_31917_length_362_cov_0.977186_1_plen_22_part_10